MSEDKEITIVILGDSTVQNYNEPNRCGWGQVIGEYFKDGVKIVNLAAGGRSTKTFISEGRLDKALATNADFALIQFGHNDSHDKGRPEATDADGDYKEYLHQYAKTFREKNSDTIFVTPMHRRLFKDGKVCPYSLAKYAKAMKEVAEEEKLPCIDLLTSSGKVFNTLGEEASVQLSCKPEDRSHFSPMGARIMAKLILKGLIEADHPLAKYLKPEVIEALKKTTPEKIAEEAVKKSDAKIPQTEEK
ncbi:MAG: rhamnogalacturonan acetylesterase [Planctomycetes bacterium]|nr:rhamnogalacturonan acetylesterase [Planctomycetota bacterium]